MLGSMLKEKSETLTLQIKASGPLKGILAVSDSKGNVRGYVSNPQANVPQKGK